MDGIIFKMSFWSPKFSVSCKVMFPSKRNYDVILSLGHIHVYIVLHECVSFELLTWVEWRVKKIDKKKLHKWIEYISFLWYLMQTYPQTIKNMQNILLLSVTLYFNFLLFGSNMLHRRTRNMKKKFKQMSHFQWR